MRDAECVAFLQWALPHLRMRWAGFRNVRRQVCRRIQRRISDLALGNVAAYRAFIETHAAEWKTLDSTCRITISRFYRDQAVFEVLGSSVLPRLAQQVLSQNRRVLRVWSAGCASGEEPYTVALLWEFTLARAPARCGIMIVGTDSQPDLLRRAVAAKYPPSALRDIPNEWKCAFQIDGDGFRLADRYRAPVHLVAHDLRDGPPGGTFDLVLCRNLAFTYWDEALQVGTAQAIAGVLRSGGALVIGVHEKLPDSATGFRPHEGSRCVSWRR